VLSHVNLTIASPTTRQEDDSNPTVTATAANNGNFRDFFMRDTSSLFGVYGLKKGRRRETRTAAR
jgi:hypothetical protein